MTNHSILLVDDEEIIRKTISADLRDKGYNVAVAESGEEALKALQKAKDKDVNGRSAARPSSYDLVITDLKMELIDGIQVLKTVKEISPETMVIILTGYGNLQSAIDAIRLHADDYVLKPCNIEELDFRIAHCLKRREIQRKIKLYEKILPVCCVCKKIRDDAGVRHGTGEWMDMEVYIRDKAGIDVSHGYCPECAEKTLREAGITKIPR